MIAKSQANHALKELRKFIDGMDEIVLPEHRNVMLEAAKGALYFQTYILEEFVTQQDDRMDE